jgi:hypothetical protein
MIICGFYFLKSLRSFLATGDKYKITFYDGYVATNDQFQPL